MFTRICCCFPKFCIQVLGGNLLTFKPSNSAGEHSGTFRETFPSPLYCPTISPQSPFPSSPSFFPFSPHLPPPSPCTLSLPYPFIPSPSPLSLLFWTYKYITFGIIDLNPQIIEFIKRVIVLRPLRGEVVLLKQQHAYGFCKF